RGGGLQGLPAGGADPRRHGLRQGVPRRAADARGHAAAPGAGEPEHGAQLHLPECAGAAALVLSARQVYFRPSGSLSPLGAATPTCRHGWGRASHPGTIPGCGPSLPAAASREAPFEYLPPAGSGLWGPAGVQLVHTPGTCRRGKLPSRWMSSRQSCATAIVRALIGPVGRRASVLGPFCVYTLGAYIPWPRSLSLPTPCRASG